MNPSSRAIPALGLGLTPSIGMDKPPILPGSWEECSWGTPLGEMPPSIIP